MLNKLFFIVFSLLMATPVIAENQPLPNFPMLGYVENDLLYVPTYRKIHGKIPEQLFAYGDGKEFIAKLRTKDSFIPSDKGGECPDNSIGHYVYETQHSSKEIKVVIFDKKKNVHFKKNKIIEPASHTEWSILFLTSHEGVHDILRIDKNGMCINHIDYYTHCNYDTEADNEQAFTSAMCGNAVQGSSTGF